MTRIEWEKDNFEFVNGPTLVLPIDGDIYHFYYILGSNQDTDVCVVFENDVLKGTFPAEKVHIETKFWIDE